MKIDLDKLTPRQIERLRWELSQVAQEEDHILIVGVKLSLMP